MGVPLTHKLKKHRIKLGLLLGVAGLLCYHHNSAVLDLTNDVTSHLPNVKEPILPVNTAPPENTPTGDELKQPPSSTDTQYVDELDEELVVVSQELPTTTQGLPKLKETPPANTRPRVKPDGPPTFAHAAPVSIRADTIEAFTEFTDEQYNETEILFLTGLGTRLGEDHDTELLEPVKQLPRRRKFPVDKVRPLPDYSTGRPVPKIQADKLQKEDPSHKTTRMLRMDMVKEAFLVSWNQYKKYAWGKDEVRPVSNVGFDPFAGWAATLVDALDTLWIMGLTREFHEALTVVEKIDFSTSFRNDIPLFETVIRYLGGLLAAYDLSNEPILLQKAIELGDNLMGAFDTPNHMPLVSFLWTNEFQKYLFRASSRTSFAEVGSLSVEFTRLAQLSGNATYFDAIDRITDAIYTAAPKMSIPYLFPAYLDASGCNVSEWTEPTDLFQQLLNTATTPTNTPVPLKQTEKDEEERARQAKILQKVYGPAGDKLPTEQVDTDDSQLHKRSVYEGQSRPVIRAHGRGQTAILNCTETDPLGRIKSFMEKFTLGGLTDSTYEYYPKEYLLLNGTDERYKTLYTEMVDAAAKHLIFRPWAEGDPDVLMMGNTVRYGDKGTERETEVSHLACFAGGMFALGGKVFNRPADVAMAAKLTEGCVWAYNATRSGVMPESFHVRACPPRLSTETADPPCHFDFATIFEDYAERDKLAVADLKAQGQPTKKGGSPMFGYAYNTKEVDDPATGGKRWPVMKAHDMPRSFYRMDARYLLRPEALESVFYMHRVTADPKWQEHGWAMVSSILKLTAVRDGTDENDPARVTGYSAVRDVTDDRPAEATNGNGEKGNWLDESESFWMGETLKYAYLLFSDQEVVSLDRYVFNTEAHPLRRPGVEYERV